MAYAALPASLRTEHPLLLVCTHKGLQPRLEVAVRELGLEGSVCYAEQVTDVDLVRLYNAAAVFAFPSLQEGFGLPPLEAMACGAPVVASRCSSLPEVVGDAGLLVTPGNPAELTGTLARILSDRTLAASLRQLGIVRAGQFSWAVAAARTVAVYDKIIAACC